MKIVKILALSFATIVLLALIVVGIFLATFDANEYKQELSDLVKQQTGRELTFTGDIGLSLYPALGMKLGSMNFANAPGFNETPMLAVNQASVSVDILSLLSFQPEIDQLVLDGLSINLQKNKAGKTNWDDLTGDASGTDVSATAPADEPDQTPEAGKGLKLQGSFGGLNITNAQLKWSDASTGSVYDIQDLAVTSGRITLDQAFPVKIRMVMQSVNEFDTQLDITADVLLSEEKVTLNSLKLDSQLTGKLVPVDQLALNLAGDVVFSLLNNQLSMTGFNTTIKTTGGVLQSSNTTLSGEIGFDLDRQQLTIAVLDIQSSLSGEAVPNNSLKTSLSAKQLEVKLNQRTIALEDLMLALNENTFKGFLTVQDYAQPALSFALSSERFDVDGLMGTKPEVVAEEAVSAEKPAEDVQIALPMQLLRDLKLDGKLDITTLIAQGLTLNNVLLKVKANKGIVDIKPFNMDLYDGKFRAAIQLNAQSDEPVYSINNKLSSFQVGAFLQDFMDNDLVSGDANIALDLTTRGEWLSQLKSNLNGDIDILIKDGALKGFNLRHKIETARAKLRREKEPELVERKTDFSALSLSGVIKNGVLTTNDLDMQAPLVRVGGKGSVNIPQETVDYMVDSKLVATTKGQDGGTADELSGLLIPVAITGSWLAPKIDVQLDEMLKAKLNAEKAKIREKMNQQKAEVQEKLAAEKAKLKAAQQKQAEAKKQQLAKKRELEEAEAKAKLEAEKQKKQAELDAKKATEKEKAKKKLEDKLKKLF